VDIILYPILLYIEERRTYRVVGGTKINILPSTPNYLYYEYIHPTDS